MVTAQGGGGGGARGIRIITATWLHTSIKNADLFVGDALF